MREQKVNMEDGASKALNKRGRGVINNKRRIDGKEGGGVKGKNRWVRKG